MKRPELVVAALLVVSILSGLGLTVVYAAGGQAQLEGALLASSLLGLGAALILWAKRLLPPEEIVQRRDIGTSRPEEREAAEVAIELGQEQIARRRLLTRLLVAAAGALGLAAVFPIRSLGPSPGSTLFRTSWRAGSRLVTSDGSPVRIDDLGIGGVATVFPEGATNAADSQTLLIHVEPELLRLPETRRSWAPNGLVAYSKVCTHAGCPVGLYLETTHELRCPCHQSTFDVLTGATPVYGPASRPLPQLPIEIAADGTLVARGDFPEPIGPSFWDRP